MTEQQARKKAEEIIGELDGFVEDYPRLLSAFTSALLESSNPHRDIVPLLEASADALKELHAVKGPKVRAMSDPMDSNTADKCREALSSAIISQKCMAEQIQEHHSKHHRDVIATIGINQAIQIINFHEKALERLGP